MKQIRRDPPLLEDLPGILADELDMRVHETVDLDFERMKSHRRLVDAWMAEHPDLVTAALDEAMKHPHFECDTAVQMLLPHLIPLAGVRDFPRPLYGTWPPVTTQ